MTEPYSFETASERERAAFDAGSEAALDPAGMDWGDVLLLLAIAQDALSRLVRENREQG